jgi:hypothetical protein
MSSPVLNLEHCTSNRATILAGALADHEGHTIARVVIDKALNGDAVAARFLIGHLTPRPRGRAVTLAVPKGARAGDTVAAFNATLRAMAAGEITPDEALTITRVLDGRFKALKAVQLERKLTWYHGGEIPGDELFAADDKDESSAAVPAASRPEAGATARGKARRENPRPDPLPDGEGASPANTLHRDDPSHPLAAEAASGRPKHLEEVAAILRPLHSACIREPSVTKTPRRLALEAELMALMQQHGVTPEAPPAAG